MSKLADRDKTRAHNDAVIRRQQKYETPTLTAYELPDARAVAAEWLTAEHDHAVSVGSRQPWAFQVARLSELITAERLRLVEAFARVVRRVR